MPLTHHRWKDLMTAAITVAFLAMAPLAVAVVRGSIG
jgi:hypothetical protein